VFEEEYQDFWKEQVRGASGQRLEMLQRDLTGTKKLLEMLLKPVLGTFKGLILEHEMVSLSGTKIYGDTFHPQAADSVRGGQFCYPRRENHKRPFFVREGACTFNRNTRIYILSV
jgi:hypothetical protein